MSDPADDIMRATYCALCERGYADLTMQDIADRSDRSKAALHYHYESKHGLMVAFLEYLFERFRGRLDEYAGPSDDGAEDQFADADEQLRAFLDAVLHPPQVGDEAREFRTALLEITAQAPYDEAFRERLVRFDDYLFDAVRDLVAAGVEEGTYDEDADPDEVARFVVTLVDGAQTRHVVTDADLDRVQAALESYLDATLRVPDEVTS